jgi:hypothetical protein
VPELEPVMELEPVPELELVPELEPVPELELELVPERHKQKESRQLMLRLRTLREYIF